LDVPGQIRVLTGIGPDIKKQGLEPGTECFTEALSIGFVANGSPHFPTGIDQAPCCRMADTAAYPGNQRNGFRGFIVQRLHQVEKVRQFTTIDG
jgi:hypothetical protein